MQRSDTSMMYVKYHSYKQMLYDFYMQHVLFVTFTTLKRTAPVFNRGFFGLFEFSDKYVKLGKSR